MIYLDANATMPIKPAVRHAVLEVLDHHGNPSSVHKVGRKARRYIDEARGAIAELVNVKPVQVVLTSGGTEANNLALRGIAASHIYTSGIEHDSVLTAAPTATRLPVGSDGRLDLAAAHALLATAPARALVSVMLVNNETGVIQPVAELAKIAKSFGHLVHCDAVQAIGRLPVDFEGLGSDAMTLSAHKIGGLQGAGALVVGEHVSLHAQLVGGGQEMRRRAGTENVPAIVAFGVAARLSVDDLQDMPRLANLRDALQGALSDCGGARAHVLGAAAPRVATTLSIALRGVSSETQVMAMDLAGVAVSAGSACSSGKVKASHVARAMGYEDAVAGSTLRFSLGWHTTQDDVVQAIDAWRMMAQRTANTNQAA